MIFVSISFSFRVDIGKFSCVGWVCLLCTVSRMLVNSL